MSKIHKIIVKTKSMSQYKPILTVSSLNRVLIHRHTTSNNPITIPIHKRKIQTLKSSCCVVALVALHSTHSAYRKSNSKVRLPKVPTNFRANFASKYHTKTIRQVNISIILLHWQAALPPALQTESASAAELTPTAHNVNLKLIHKSGGEMQAEALTGTKMAKLSGAKAAATNEVNGEILAVLLTVSPNVGACIISLLASGKAAGTITSVNSPVKT